MSKRVVVGMSGGVDSSVAAFLLKRQGFDVIGVTMLTWPGREDGSPDTGGVDRPVSAAVDDARRVAEKIKIPYFVMDFRREFRKCVIDYFIEEYLSGRTPNPCVVCNRWIKWEALLERSRAIGADYIATGHYARIDLLPNGRYAVRSSVTKGKDQTYALYGLTQEQLKRTLLPIGSYSKEQIRHIAEEEDLPVAHKPDSQDICFVPDGDYCAFLHREVPDRIPGSGRFVTADGTCIGRHRGIIHYTIGQRRGLGLSIGKPAFVTEIRPASNEVVIGGSEDIMSRQLICRDPCFMGMEDLREPRRCRAKIRYAHAGEDCVIEWLGGSCIENAAGGEGGRILVTFERPVRAVTPGQAVVFYDGEYVLGGGIIER